MNEVLDRVCALMKEDLDRFVLLSGSMTLRWRNTAQWARNTLYALGCVHGDTSHGMWRLRRRDRRGWNNANSSEAGFPLSVFLVWNRLCITHPIGG